MKLAYRKHVPKKRGGWDIGRAITASETVRKPTITLPRLKWMEERNGEGPAREHDGAGREAGDGSGPRREVGSLAEGGAEIGSGAQSSGQERAGAAAPGSEEGRLPEGEEVSGFLSDFGRIQGPESDGIGPFCRPTTGSGESLT